MNKLTLIVLAGAMALSCRNKKKLGANIPTDRAKNAMEASATVDSATMMKAWETYMQPAEAHYKMAKWTGNWNAELTFYNMGTQPTTAKAKANYQMILGGRYLKCRYTGMIDNKPFEGENITAFDNARKVYISTWIDNMGTGLMYMEGAYDKLNRKYNYKGRANDVATGKPFDIREIHTILDNRTQQMEMYDIKNGKEVKTMMIKLSRIK